MIIASIGIIVFNEEKNIGKLLEKLLKQKLTSVEIKEIVIVSSACRDNTEKIVQNFMKIDSRIKLIVQKNREGKSSAINLWLKRLDKDVDICIMESGDTIPFDDTVDKLGKAFIDPEIGMVGVRPIPNNDKGNFVGYAVNLLWKLHHFMALDSPKLGEMVAFRNIIESIPRDSAVDEASIEAEVVKNNLKLKYEPDAFVINHGPENISDFIKQRRRIAAGHKWLAEHYKYTVSTANSFKVFNILLKTISVNNIKELFFIIGTISLEMYSRFLGFYDYEIKKKNPFKWDVVESTKEVIK